MTARVKPWGGNILGKENQYGLSGADEGESAAKSLWGVRVWQTCRTLQASMAFTTQKLLMSRRKHPRRCSLPGGPWTLSCLQRPLSPAPLASSSQAHLGWTQDAGSAFVLTPPQSTLQTWLGSLSTSALSTPGDLRLSASGKLPFTCTQESDLEKWCNFGPVQVGAYKAPKEGKSTLNRVALTPPHWPISYLLPHAGISPRMPSLLWITLGHVKRLVILLEKKYHWNLGS